MRSYYMSLRLCLWADFTFCTRRGCNSLSHQPLANPRRITTIQTLPTVLLSSNRSLIRLEMPSLLQSSRALYHASRLRSLAPLHSPHLIRSYHPAPTLRLPYKDDQDRESLKPRSHEGSKSASDSDVASHLDTSFEPKSTDPKRESKEAKRESKDAKGDPLELSGANQDLSKPPSGSGDRAGGEKKRKSGPGGPAKHGKPV